MKQDTIVCIVAGAGRGKRFGRELPKGFYPVEGVTLLARTLRSLRAYGGISRYIVVVPEGWEERAEDELRKETQGFSYTVVAGGETRQGSVAAGLNAVESADIVLVHDACRPIVSPGLIGRVIDAARETGAAVPALEATETLGRIKDDGLKGIVPRERVVGIQTPQAFRLDCLRKAFDAGGGSAGTATDESSLVMAAGYPVRVVRGERWNIKVTLKEDLEIIESFMTEKKLVMPEGDGTE